MTERQAEQPAPLQRLAVDEFAEDGSWRDGGDLGRGQGDDVAEELEHAAGLRVGWGRRRDAAQERLGEVFEHRQLEDVRGVEDGVGVFLEREDVAVFAAADALPHGDGILRVDAAGAVVTDHASEHAVVRCRNVVVFVDRQRCERGCIDTEDLRAIDIRNHGRVQRMDAFHDEDVLFVELHLVAFEEFAAFLEIEARDLDFLAGEKVIELLSEKLEVHGTETFEVIFTVLVTRSELPVYKVVIELDDLWIEAEDTALKGESL